ncbi:MAG: 2-oxoacid:ferredoxin oxidoreductase subunit alpha [Omnitrophica WOR_2 bacterium GWF2_38_59]|nr:MAG: 2-oxoacid:ferredoxin oxidoreductase subunit alpha [Omnitrophica WOR_2 bacterium GWF2_38_59]OGX56459.1 MAG: 2-oxoacid:ferredoxin oxidoreductase subunit alpha [Omnitrophica WOR_2 bacterium RIFOXYB2_FULL_38_16]HBG61597.1 2-oxoacid:acceptor oxidoreductase subunit alpha [Candidatus Omnitrophota bacterium]
MDKKLKQRDDLSIVIAGEAGQGIETIEIILTKLLKRAGYNVFAAKEYMSRVRGGTNSIGIRISSRPVACFVNRIDIVFPLDKKAIMRLKPRMTEKTIIVGDKKALATDEKIIDIPFLDLAESIGNPIFANIIAVGFAIGLLDIGQDVLLLFLSEYFSKKGKEIIDQNVRAGQIGWDLGQEKQKSLDISFEIKKDISVANEFIINGHQAISLGAIAGGCNFIPSYPMSPSTGVLTFMAQQGENFGIVVEQAEDEISAINMGLGSWYAGGRSMVTTSGGGFALMTEGISLAGCIESPMVIHLAQRPGPATGLPTRTEQGDLELALYAGHGEFPRVIYAPGNIQDAFLCAYKAFELADKYQVPVIILTDQLLLDSYYNISGLPIITEEIKNLIIKTQAGYKRYQITENGISDRGIPGYGEGFVCVDSDEHDEGGYITEDFDTRIAMVDKRLKKGELLKQEILEPEFYGDQDYEKLVVGWGSTNHVILEAMRSKENNGIGYLYFKQIYPLSEKIEEYWKRSKEVIFVENNATGQFEKLIRREFGLSANRHIRKYNGLPFSVEEVFEQL